MALQAGANPSFTSMKQLGVFLLPPEWDASPSQGNPSIKFAGTLLYTWVKRDTVRVSCPRSNTIYPSGLKPRPVAPESSVLNMRPLHHGRSMEVIRVWPISIQPSLKLTK